MACSCNGMPGMRGAPAQAREELDVVVTGLSGRMPESDSIQEFADQLFAGVDLVTADGRRWTPGMYGMPERCGKLKELARFDATFFGVSGKQAHLMDPQLRLLLELTYECIVDAGLSPIELRGSRTGVFVGGSNSESAERWSEDPNKINGYALTGCSHAMFPNQISYAFDLKGPSYAVDTACSSSLSALAQAVAAMRAGDCDAAFVASTNLCLKPLISLSLHRLSMLSPEGRCAAFDASGRGYVRAEAVVCVLLQPRSAARRLYAHVRGARVNNDGAKEQGITFPSGDMQRRLAAETFAEAGLRPHDVAYIEAHGTGTKVGDPQEVNAIAELFCSGRTKPLLLGSVKSNMGHAELAAGLCSIAKVIVAMERGEIPANLHYRTPNPDIPALSDGRIEVVARNTKWDGGLVAINSLGFGGANAHLIMESASGTRPPPAQYSVPRLLVASGRTDAAVRALLAQGAAHAHDAELHALLDAVHAHHIPGHARRGYRLLLDGTAPPTEDVQEWGGDGGLRPVWWVFSGMGSQLAGKARALLALPVFAASIQRSAAALRPHRLDLVHILTAADDAAFDDVINSLVSITAVQVALVDVLRAIGIKPDGIVGTSAGEVGCAYADDTLSCEQAVLCAYWRGRSIQDAGLEPGAMAAVEISWEECRRRLPADCVIASYNTSDDVTVSGPFASVERLVAELSAEGVFARKVNSSGVAFHSKHIEPAAPLLRKSLEKVIPVPRPRSSRWVSTSLPRDQWDSDLAKLFDAEYYVNNLLSPVWLTDALKEVPGNAIVVEVAPHALLQPLLRHALPGGVMVPLLRREAPDALNHLLAAVGKLYIAGLQPRVGALYPAVSWPVSRGTPGLASHVLWDHSAEWSVAHFGGAPRSRDIVVEFDLQRPEDAFLTGHNIDSLILFPATGYITLVWHTLAKLHNRKPEETAVVLEDVQFFRATIMLRDAPTRFLVSVLEGLGYFEVRDGSAVVVCGSVRFAEDPAAERFTLPPPETAPSTEADLLPLDMDDVYKELRLRGYHYGGVFRGIRASDARCTAGRLAWDGNWMSFMDTMLQFDNIGKNTRGLKVPTRLQRALIDPVAHAAALARLPDQQNEPATLPIRMARDVHVVTAGGVELRGLKLCIVPRRANPQPAPKLEKYVFVPYYNASVSTEDTSGSKRAALTAALQLALELAGDVRLKVAEAALGRAADALLLPRTLALLAAEPMVHVDATLAAGSNHQQYQMPLKDQNIKVTNKEVSGASAGKDKSKLEGCHLVVAVDVVSRHGPGVLAALASWLAPNGTLLLEESLRHLDKPQVKQDIDKAGLLLVSRQMAASCEFVLLKPKLAITTTHVVIELEEDPAYGWVEPLKAALARADKEVLRVYLVARGKDSGALGLTTCLRAEVGCAAVRLFLVPGEKQPFSLSSGPFAAQAQLDLPINVCRAGVWGCYRHLPLPDVTVAMTQVEHAYVNTMTRGDLSSLRWIESPLRYAHAAPLPKNTELCRVCYAPLNFRDIMMATGKLPSDALPGNLAGQKCVLGLEFAGHDSSGRRVMGMVAAQGLATYVMADRGFLWPVPGAWTLEEAATVPVAYATAYYALSVRGRMRRGESVLVHAGAGGVGQAAIAIALHAGCTVFTTVSTTAEKRAFIRQRFPEIPDAHIGNSRDCSFEQLVLTRTRGRGVDLVLNSLAADKLLASVRCLASGGRFLEIGKVDLSNNTPLGMAIFLKNTTFHGILLDALLEAGDDDADKAAVVRCMDAGLASGAVRPLPRTVYADTQLEQAFRFMATGKHIGKVMLRVREEESGAEVGLGRARLVSALARTYLHPARAYVLVGGLGGFGLELANWLVTRGARLLVLNSRSGVRTGYQAWRIRRWREHGVTVLVSRDDVTTHAGAEQLLKESARLGPVGGVFNLAAVLRNAFLENLTPDDFKTVTKPKIDATRNLDAATRLLAPELEYFVCFSSLSSGRGTVGQTNYGLANSCMERICEARQADGLPALAVQWGPIGEVGLIVETVSSDDDTELAGTIPQRMASCLEALETLLALPYAVAASMVLADKRRAGAAGATTDLVHAVANILGIKDPSSVSQSARLMELGMDSLMCTEIKQTLERSHDLVLRQREIRELSFARLNQLAGTCRGGTEGKAGGESVDKASVENGTAANGDVQMVALGELMPTQVAV